eukprot:CAMPEP_0204256462 /NCGR_PEP_ID=MMETSP0468-20130131/3802_1 /ASSEMBLY_ACC=CAM_ASM_000383 /TAXON_ID=2969 /ORGANISM="Oxyrrhis marina" /LENGTH=86 /DNA_ID=CAMNT_0051230429 /DNA_START=167 /DNA_END=427 /DNA_ORIENTATION=-
MEMYGSARSSGCGSSLGSEHMTVNLSSSRRTRRSERKGKLCHGFEITNSLIVSETKTSACHNPASFTLHTLLCKTAGSAGGPAIEL